MKNLLFFLLCSCSWLYCQDAKPDPRLSLMLEILNGCDTSINVLEENMNASNLIISGLLKTSDSMLNTIETQRRQLDAALRNSEGLKAEALERSQNYEAALLSLEESLKRLSQDNKEKDAAILSLAEKNSGLKGVIIKMGGALLAIAAFIAVKAALRRRLF